MRRFARGFGVVALAAVALVALLVGSAFTVLRTSWGGDFVKRLAVPRINAAIAGSVQLGRFSFGGDHLALQDLVLRDPEGGVVLRVRALEVAFDPLALLRKRVRIGQLTVTEPSLFVRQDPAGLNLSRALAARAPSAPEAAGPKPAKSSAGSGVLKIDLADLRVADGSVELRSTPSAAGRAAWRVSALAVDGEAHYDAGPATFVVSLQASARMHEPLQARFDLQIAGRGSGDRRELAVRSNLGDSSIAAEVRTESATRGTLDLTRLHVTPELVRTLAPAVALLIPIDMTAKVAREASSFSFGTEVKTTAGTLESHGTVDTSAARVRPVAVSAKGVDLGRIIAGLPRSNLSLTARGEGVGRDLQALSGTVTIEMPVGRVNGASVGPVAISLTATGGQYEVAELHVALPGLTIVGHGPVGPARLSFGLGVDARDLGLTSRTLSSFRGLHAPPFSGRGKVDVSLSGTTRQPSVHVSARFPRLTVGEDRVTDLKLEARAPDARTPEVASAELQVAEARLAGRSLHRGSVRLRSGSGRLDADLQLGGPTPLSLVAGGTWGADHQSFELDQLRLRYPEAAWTMAGKAHLSWRPEHRAVTGLDLRAGRQRIRLSLGEHGSHLRAKATLEEIDLGRLPRIAQPPGTALGGRLDLDGELEAELEGGFGQPVARLKMNLRNGRLGGYRDLALALDGHYRGGRVVGRLDARGLGSGVEARFDLPTEWPLADARGPLTLDLTVPETDLASVLAAADVPVRRRIGGRVGIVLHLQGTARAPVLHLDTTARGLVVDGQTLGDLSLRVSADAGAPVVVALKVGPSAQSVVARPAPGASRETPPLCAGAIEVRTDLSLASLTRRLPSAAELMGTYFDVTGDLAGIPLLTLAGLAQSTAVSGGSASLRVSASGTARAPTGALNLQLAGATGPRFPPTDARLDAAFGEQDTRVALRILRKGRELLSASGILGVASRRLKDLGALTRAPLKLTAAVGPLHLSRDAIPGTFGPTGSEALSTNLRAALSVDGTLEHPDLKLSADLSDGRLGARPIGTARILLTYKGQEAAADVQVRSAAKGALRLTDRTTIDLGYPRVTAGVDLDKLVLDARLTAERFDLGLLSGVTKEVRKVGGELSATVTARGPARAPSVRGQMEWTNGVLTLLGLGDYAKIHLKAHGDETALWLDELSLASGEGNARVTGQASRRGDRGYDLQASASLGRFPVYGQGEVLALVSIDGAVKGRASPDDLKASAHVSEAHVELTDAKQKSLQSLARPADVILVDDGKPVNRAEATKLAALSEDLGGRRLAEGSAATEASPVGAPPSFRLQLGIDAPRNLWVRGKDASIELGVGPDFRVEVNGPPKIYGQVIIRRGRIDVLGRRFDLQAGSLIRFIGPADAPRLDVSARYFNETENITVLLTARGTLDKLTIAVSSPDRPDLTEGQLYTLIVTGRLQLGGNTAGSTGVSGEAASLVGGIVAAQLQKTLAKRLPLDVLTLQAGEGLTGSRLEAGTYLTTKLYAGYVGRVGANPALLQNRNAVHVEYQLSRRWSFDGEYGDVGTGTADILWTKHY